MEKHKDTKKEGLEKIKEEIINKDNPSKNTKKLYWGSAVVASALILLSLISVTQVVQSATILNKIKSGTIKPASAESLNSPVLPSSLENLPNMVGGC